MTTDKRKILCLLLMNRLDEVQAMLDKMNDKDRYAILNNFNDACDSVLIIAMNLTPPIIRVKAIDMLLKAGADPEKLNKLQTTHTELTKELIDIFK